MRVRGQTESAAVKKIFLTSLIMILSFLGLVRNPAEAAGLDRGVMKVEFLYAINYAAGRMEKFQEPMDLFFDKKNKELYIVDAAKHKIFVYDQNGIFIQEIKTDAAGGASGAPRAVAVDGKGRIFTAHLYSPKINMLDYRGEFLESLLLPKILDLPGNKVLPSYMTAGNDGRLYVLKTTGEVVRIDTDSNSMDEIAVSGEGAPNMIYGMAVDGAGRFIFTDMRPSSVVIFDPKNKEFKRFGKAGVLYGQLDRPAGVATDDRGHIFVANTVTNKISCFDRDGTFIEEFGKIGERLGQFYMPSKIASDGKDRLYVLENTLKRVQVFRVEFLEETEAAGSVTASTGGNQEMLSN